MTKLIEDSENQGAQNAPRAEFLRSQLRRAIITTREGCGYSQKQVAEQLDWSVSKVSRIESGNVGVSPSDVRAFFSLMEADSETIRQHANLAYEARRARSWQDYSDVISRDYANFIGIEQSADHALKHETGVVPGLLQTEDYSFAVYDGLGFSTPTAKRLVEVRQIRQGLLDESDAPELTVVMSEFCLVCQVGDSEVMRRQIERLVEYADHPRITLLLVPFSAGAYPGIGTPFTILKFQEDGLPPALFFEDGLRQANSEEDESIVDEWSQAFLEIIRIAEGSGSFADHASRVLNSHT